jgi:glycosyltransferase involved in cell wall biosynthesis
VSAPRIAFVIGTLGLGGAETQVVGVAQRLHASGVSVEVVLLNGRGPLMQQLEQDDIPVHCIDYPGVRFRDDRRRLRPWLVVVDLLRLLGVTRLLRRRRFDVVHAYLFHAYALAIPLAWLARVPVRVAARRGLHAALPRHLLLGPLTRLSTRLATAVVANSTAVADDARQTEGVPASKLHVIPNAVDLPQRLARPEIEPAVGLIIANLIHYKGHLDLVAALAALEHPPVIRCIGEGPMREPVEQAIAAAGLTDVMILEGRQVDARSCYQGVQFAVLASHSEGLPNAVLEAMAAGLPVVATDVGGCRELVEDGVTGRLVPARDPLAMAGALQEVASDPSFRARAGRAGRERAESYSWAACAQAHLDLYGRLLAARAAAR